MAANIFMLICKSSASVWKPGPCERNYDCKWKTVTKLHFIWGIEKVLYFRPANSTPTAKVLVISAKFTLSISQVKLGKWIKLHFHNISNGKEDGKRSSIDNVHNNWPTMDASLSFFLVVGIKAFPLWKCLHSSRVPKACIMVGSSADLCTNCTGWDTNELALLRYLLRTCFCFGHNKVLFKTVYRIIILVNETKLNWNIHCTRQFVILHLSFRLLIYWHTFSLRSSSKQVKNVQVTKHLLASYNFYKSIKIHFILLCTLFEFKMFASTKAEILKMHYCVLSFISNLLWVVDHVQAF